MALFDNNNTKKTSLKDMTLEQTKELAYQYASADWHNVEGTLKASGIEYNEELMQQSLFDYKLGLLQAKQERKFGLKLK